MVFFFINVAPMISTLNHLYFFERINILRNAIVIRERTQFCRKKFPIFIDPAFCINVWHFIHMFFYFQNYRVIFFFGILLVENAILFLLKPDAPKKIVRTMAATIAIFQITNFWPSVNRKFYIRCIYSSSAYFIK